MLVDLCLELLQNVQPQSTPLGRWCAKYIWENIQHEFLHVELISNALQRVEVHLVGLTRYSSVQQRLEDTLLDVSEASIRRA